MDDTFKPGDTVRLVMTIKERVDATHVKCRWHDGTKEKSGIFSDAALELVHANLIVTVPRSPRQPW